MYVALDNFVKMDHKKEWKIWEDRVATIENAVKSVKGVVTEVTVPELGNHTPTLKVSWDAAKISLPVKTLQESLRKGNPSIEVMPAENNSLTITTWMLKPGEEKIVASRLKEELSKAVV
jgi:L-seryl-tRNA(Ser) seleniumtransferase